MANPPHNPETAPLLKQKEGVSTTTPKKSKRDTYTFSPLLGATVAVVALAIACICAGTLKRVSTVSGEGQQILYETLDEVNGTGHSVTFTVHLCGVPESVWNAKVPWPVCRVKLVGCPQNDGNCGHWRYHQGVGLVCLSVALTHTHSLARSPFIHSFHSPHLAAPRQTCEYITRGGRVPVQTLTVREA